MKKIITAIVFLLPAFASASAVPAFPMAFYGGVTVNAVSAPVGTVVKAYYGTTLAGTVIVSEAGVYGYNNPIKQQLLVASGTGAIRFTITSSAINSGIETEGSSTITHAAFVSGDVVAKDLAFTYTVVVAPTPPPTPPPPPPSSRRPRGPTAAG